MTATETVTPATTSTVALSPSTQPPTGRLVMMTAYAVAATAIPFPFLPDRVIARIRGALAHDILARHGLSLTTDARASLAEPDSEMRTRLVRAAESLARQVLRRIRPLGVLSSASRGVELYALGLLLERYVVKLRRSSARAHAPRGGAPRARGDRPGPPPRHLAGAPPRGHDPQPRRRRTCATSSPAGSTPLLLTSAALPSYLERRLEAAFDEIVARDAGAPGWLRRPARKAPEDDEAAVRVAARPVAAHRHQDRLEEPRGRRLGAPRGRGRGRPARRARRAAAERRARLERRHRARRDEARPQGAPQGDGVAPGRGRGRAERAHAALRGGVRQARASPSRRCSSRTPTSPTARAPTTRATRSPRCSRRAPCRSSTRTTRSPSTRSSSATTTSSPRW